MIVNNKYKKIYDSIIYSAVGRGRECGKYYENHHILPKSLGGKDSKDNMVSLTGREHYICHYLLTKFTVKDSYHKMVCAWRWMNTDFRKKKDRYLTSRGYEHSRKAIASSISAINKGRNVGDKSYRYDDTVRVYYNHLEDFYFKGTQNEFRLRYDISSPEVCRITHNPLLMSKGFMMVTKDRPKPRPIRRMHSQNKSTDLNTYLFKHPIEGEMVCNRKRIMDVYGERYGLTIQGLSDTIKGRQKSHRGWTIYEL